MSRGRSLSPRDATKDADMDVDSHSPGKPDAKVVIVTNLTRNVVESHLKTIFGFYGHITKIDLPVFAKCQYHILAKL
jgi:RNA-binding protein with serine-rich domain 1